jgi:hypothetical protein
MKAAEGEIGYLASFWRFNPQTLPSGQFEGTGVAGRYDSQLARQNTILPTS